MLFRILAVGDVASETGLSCLTRHLRPLIKHYDIHFTVVNGENVAGVGLLPRHADEILAAGADVITLGNHTWDKIQISNYLDDSPYILRPANFAPQLPGRGHGIYEGPFGLRIAVLNLIGRMGIGYNFDSPFRTADSILEHCDADLTLVDFHAEATSEKGALAWYLDGRVQALWGTHTHVPTADSQILPKGCGFISDLGMTGPRESILGVDPSLSVQFFLGGLPQRFKAVEGPSRMDCVLFTIDSETRRCTQVLRVDVQDQ